MPRRARSRRIAATVLASVALTILGFAAPAFAVVKPTLDSTEATFTVPAHSGAKWTVNLWSKVKRLATTTGTQGVLIVSVPSWGSHPAGSTCFLQVDVLRNGRWYSGDYHRFDGCGTPPTTTTTAPGGSTTTEPSSTTTEPSSTTTEPSSTTTEPSSTTTEPSSTTTTSAGPSPTTTSSAPSTVTTGPASGVTTTLASLATAAGGSGSHPGGLLAFTGLGPGELTLVLVGALLIALGALLAFQPETRRTLAARLRSMVGRESVDRL